MSEPKVLAIADDLTGALETGAKFSQYGLTARVLTEYKSKTARDRYTALVYDIETRHLSPGHAHDRIVSMRQEFLRWPDALRYKKTDSTLRGNICAELKAFASLHPGRSIVYCSAYPAMGRTVRDGHLYVNGVPVSDTSFRDDPLNPVASSSVAELFAAGCGLPILNVAPDRLALYPTPVLYICDGETESDVDAVARFILVHHCQAIGAGPASLAEALARLISCREKTSAWPNIRSCVVVSGSLHPVSDAQVAWAESSGLTRTVDPVGDRSALPPEWTIFRYESTEQGRGRAAAMGDRLVRLVRDHDADGLLIFGGDTVHGLIAALGHPSLHALGEPLTGVALSRIAATELSSAVPERARDLYLLTKAGGFGSADLIMQLQRVLTS